MIVPLIVIGVLFLITWIVIGVSGTPVSENCHPDCNKARIDPFHYCNYTRLQGELDRTRSEVGSMRSQIRRLEDEIRYKHCIHELPKSKDPIELAEELGLLKPKEEPKEFKVEGTLKVVK